MSQSGVTRILSAERGFPIDFTRAAPVGVVRQFALVPTFHVIPFG